MQVVSLVLYDSYNVINDYRKWITFRGTTASLSTAIQPNSLESRNKNFVIHFWGLVVTLLIACTTVSEINFTYFYRNIAHG